MKDKKDHLPIFGIGPMLCFIPTGITAVAVFLSAKGILPGRIDISWLKLVMTVIGILLILEGIVLFFCADLGGKLQDNIKDIHHIWMTVILVRTEEKWLYDLYGEDYKHYCKKVNRLIPWLPR